MAIDPDHPATGIARQILNRAGAVGTSGRKLHVIASMNVPGCMSVFFALAGFAGVRMMSSRAGNRNMLSFTPQSANYRTILTASQQKSNGRESQALLRFP
jgi:hypothetical protein